MPIYLSKPAVTSAIGESIATHIQTILKPNSASPIIFSDKVYQRHHLIGKKQHFAEVTTPLRAFDPHLDPIHHSRNNQLLWHTIAQIEEQIYATIEHYGKQRIAVVIGTSTTGVDENIPQFKQFAQQNQISKGFNYQQQLFSAPADFIAAQFNLPGLCFGISTACTSGARALITAARLLKANLCDAVIAGAVDTLSPLTIAGFNSLNVISEEKTKPFDHTRSGINIGEGAAVFVLTRDNLHNSSIALLGYGASSDAHHMSSPDPEGLGAEKAFRQALDSAQLNATQIEWINLHGTGTQLNDSMEGIAVNKVFGHQIPAHSTKSFTGHTLGAAGAIEAAILWGILDPILNPKKMIPNIVPETPDPNIHILQNHQHILKHHIGASASFAFGGNNAVLILGKIE